MLRYRVKYNGIVEVQLVADDRARVGYKLFKMESGGNWAPIDEDPDTDALAFFQIDLTLEEPPVHLAVLIAPSTISGEGQTDVTLRLIGTDGSPVGPMSPGAADGEGWVAFATMQAGRPGWYELKILSEF